MDKLFSKKVNFMNRNISVLTDSFYKFKMFIKVIYILGISIDIIQIIRFFNVNIIEGKRCMDILIFVSVLTMYMYFIHSDLCVIESEYISDAFKDIMLISLSSKDIIIELDKNGEDFIDAIRDQYKKFAISFLDKMISFTKEINKELESTEKEDK